MTPKAYVLIGEHQNDHGYVDTSVLGVYLDLAVANAAVTQYEDDALGNGELVHGREDEWQAADQEEADWTVNFLVQSAPFHREEVSIGPT